MNRLLEMIFDHFWTKVVSVMIAVLLWVVVFSSRNIEATKEVPLEVITSTEVVPASDIPDKVVFRLSGPKAFLRAILDRSEQPIKINLEGAKPGTITYRFFADNIRLPIGVRVLNIVPAALSVRLEAVRYSTVPVKLDLRGLPPEGFRITRSEVHPPMVRIRGARSQVESINEIVSAPLDVSGLKHSEDLPVSFDLQHLGVSVETASPVAHIEIEAANPNYRIRNVSIRVQSSGLRYKLKQSSVTIFVRATEEDLRNLDHSKIYARVDVRGREKGDYTVPVTVVAPRDLGIVKVVPETVNVSLF